MVSNRKALESKTADYSFLVWIHSRGTAVRTKSNKNDNTGPPLSESELLGLNSTHIVLLAAAFLSRKWLLGQDVSWSAAIGWLSPQRYQATRMRGTWVERHTYRKRRYQRSALGPRNTRRQRNVFFCISITEVGWKKKGMRILAILQGHSSLWCLGVTDLVQVAAGSCFFRSARPRVRFSEARGEMFRRGCSSRVLEWGMLVHFP